MGKVLRVLFGRTSRTVLCLLVQLAALCAVLRLCSGMGGVWFQWVLRLISWVLVVVIVAGSREAGYKTAWCIVVLALPVFGLLCYILLGGSQKNQRLRQLHGTACAYLEKYLPDTNATLLELQREAPSAGAQALAITRLGGCSVYYGGEVRWFSGGEACFSAMLEELRNAERSIWLEYFIIRPGVMWDSILMILRQKAARGVDVRVIYDDFGCLAGLKRGYPNTLRRMNIRCCVCNPFTPALSACMGNRDHRKLMLIDGKICYTGGVNLSDEYIGLRQRCGHWKDGAVRLEGQAVYAFSALFLSMWEALSGEKQSAPPIPPEKNRGYCYMAPFWDSPLYPEPVGRSAIATMICRAERSVWLMTPYFVPDEALCHTLCLAASAGVEVRIITPGIGDKWYTQALTRAHYPKLLEAGVEIYEYTPGFLHTKACCADGVTAVVGTVNLDYRSFYLQFENGLWLYGKSAVSQIAADFTQTLTKCRRITSAQATEVAWPKKAGRAILRLFAPLV